MKRLINLGIMVILMVGLSVGLYSNGLNLSGNGSKALGMGGAFVGLADDYSAVFWNPAGLTQMKETSVTLYGSDVIPKPTYKWDLFNIDLKGKNKHYLTPGFGFFKPLSEKIVVGIYAFAPSGIGACYNGSDLVNISGGNYFWESKIGLLTVSPAIAIKLTDQLSFGGAFNINYGMLTLKKPGLGQYDEDLTGWALSGAFGLLFKPNDIFSIGFTYRTPISVTLKGDANMVDADLVGLPTKDHLERSGKWPMWLAGGVAVKASPKLTFTADVQFTNWKKLEIISATYSNAGWKTYFEEDSTMPLYWKNATQMRFGVEYKATQRFALRAGFYFDPYVGNKSYQNILMPEVGYKTVTFGFGYKTPKVTLDFGVECAFGKDVTVGLLDGGMPGIHGMTLFIPNVAVTINL